jgi:hypothetical protein
VTGQTAGPLRRVDPLRIRHIRGEALRGDDFGDQSDQDDQRRWWHNRALHRAFGIVSGLDVTIENGVATVAPGLAFDCHGRELVLETPRQVQVQEGAESAHLVVARRGDGVTVCWLPAEVRTSGVRLDAPGASAAPRVRPFARPQIGRGATVPGSTAWEPWSERSGEQPLHLGIQVDVDTSAAGFTATPCYFAQLTGSTWDARLPRMLCVPFDHLARQRRDRFTFRLLMPWLYLFTASPGPELVAAASSTDDMEAFRRLAQITDLAVTWIGIQHRTEGQP